ncbi:MAG: exonuclease [Methanosarcinales archaeon]|uniref:Exonuclease n=1 Tax=Candidatus Ethanoperedens thermophilum TaxID=2766897 RepID=A0A848DAQ4_9EURY|nr:exonuclease [Candidatus Ethanoperedens thermophilum]
MLTSTYVHIPRIGRTIEHRIWSCGARTWSEFAEHQDEIPISAAKKTTILAGIDESMQHLSAHDAEFFAKSLPKSEHWRAYRDFKDKIAFVDIETTGLSPRHSRMTVVGIYDGKKTKAYVRGIDLDDIVCEIVKYDFLVTYNGARFDLPFIKHEYPELEFNQLHMDLMYPLRRIGYTGGLKAIEQVLGITRSEDTTGMTGFDAVRLWHEYEHGNDDALSLLLKYNQEDIVNLETIIELVHPMFVEDAFSAVGNV